MTIGTGNGTTSAEKILRRPDGRLFVTGTAHDGMRFVFAVAALTSTGAPDPTFSGDGKVLSPILAGDAFVKTTVVSWW